MRTELATADSPPLRPFSRHIRPTRSEPSQWNGSAMPPSSLPRAVGSSTPLAWSVTSPSTWPCLFCGPRQAEVRADAPVEDLHLGLACRPAGRSPRRRTKPRPLIELVLDVEQPVVQGRQREVVAAELEHVVGAFERVAQRGVELGLLGVVEQLGPRVLVGDVRGGPLALGLEHPRRHRHRHNSVRPGCGPQPTSSPAG